jgi:16S rRNA (guanine966-N2)-methyltransferase
VRIIGGKWRSRSLPWHPGASLRPTPVAVRETLFNWLGPQVSGSRCLDLFAGSGALGFEAASRGASRVVMVESDRAVFAGLIGIRSRLAATTVECLHTEAQRFLASPARERFDIVFLDPPFSHNLVAPACELLDAGNWLATQALIYVEAEIHLDPLPIPSSWHIIRSRGRGAVGYHLLKRYAP